MTLVGVREEAVEEDSVETLPKSPVLSSAVMTFLGDSALEVTFPL